MTEFQEQTPLHRYLDHLKKSEILEDKSQYQAVLELNRVYLELLALRNRKKHNFFQIYKPKPVKGLYLYGGVGRGKTFLMDLFFESLPFTEKLRLHFYRFMQRIHQELKNLAHEANPLKLLAKSLSKEALVICFDEFIVEDIADAMILGGLFEALFYEGVTLVATSNVPPSDLYKEGLQRDRFMPAIKTINKNVKIICVDSGKDYRGQEKNNSLPVRYFTPLDGEKAWMQGQFEMLTLGETLESSDFILCDRPVQAVARTNKTIWFEFDFLCGEGRGVADYIALSEKYKTILLSNVVKMYDGLDDYARRFIALIDELYDRKIILIISAQVPIHELYRGSRLEFSFERTKSRLIEMQKMLT